MERTCVSSTAILPTIRVSTGAKRRSTGAVWMLASSCAAGERRNWRGAKVSPTSGAATGIRSIAHSGHWPGLGWRICGCIEQVHVSPCSATAAGACPLGASEPLKPQPTIKPTIPATTPVAIICFVAFIIGCPPWVRRPAFQSRPNAEPGRSAPVRTLAGTPAECVGRR